MAERYRETDRSHEELAEGGVLVLDMPVIHRGYLDLLQRHADQGTLRTLYLVGEDVIDELGVPKEIRAVDPEMIRDLLRGLYLPFNIEILHLDQMGNLPQTGLFTARDEVSRRIRDKYFADAKLTEENVFLRWDTSNTTVDRPGGFERETNDQFHVDMIKRTRELADLSSDWWRQVGVVIVRDGQILVEAYNKGFPTENAPYVDGNPRDHIQAGTLGFLSGTLHGEQAAIAKASRQQSGTQGADLYLNSYPCHACASMMGEAGIARVFFSGGNAYLNVEETLKAAGIESIFVRDDQPIGK